MTLFNENIELLLGSPDGPVGLFIQHRAAEVQALVQADVRMIMGRLEGDPVLDEVVSEVQVQMDGTTALIGFLNTGQEITEYLANKSVKEQEKLTAGALAKVFTT